MSFFSLGLNKRNEKIKGLVASTGQHAFQLALQYSNDTDTAKDIVQQSLLKVLGKNRLPNDGLNYWFLTIVRNTAIDLIRSEQIKQRFADEVKQHELRTKTTESTSDALLQKEQRLIDKTRIDVALKMLTIEQREIIVLRDLQDYSYKQIAIILGIAKGTVMSRLHRARLALKDEVMKL